jgi:glycosyltransferase involved in cell wall biosynthesis
VTGELSVSIVTPTLNAQRYLGQCLASVSDQAASLEQLIVDGGSSDATETIARAHGARFVSLPGLKQAAAINAGLRLASGDVVAWLNADDAYVPGSLTKVVRLFGTTSQIDVIFGDCEFIDQQGRLLWCLRPGPYDFNRLLRKGNYLAQPAVFLRKRVFERTGYLDETLDFGMDYDLWLRLRDFNVYYVNEVLAQFRWHTDSKSARHPLGNWREGMAVIRRNGGGWTPALAYAFGRMLVSVVKTNGIRGVQYLLRANSEPQKRTTPAR